MFNCFFEVQFHLLFGNQVRVLWRNRSNSMDTYHKTGFGRLAHKIQVRESNNSWLYAREAENLGVTQSTRLDATVVPIMPWRPGELLHSCSSFVHIERLKKLVQSQRRTVAAAVREWMCSLARTEGREAEALLLFPLGRPLKIRAQRSSRTSS